ALGSSRYAAITTRDDSIGGLWAVQQQRQQRPPPTTTTKYLETSPAPEMDATGDGLRRSHENGRRSMERVIGGEDGPPANEMMEEGPPNLQDQGAGNNGVEAEEEGREGQPVAYVECYSDWRVLKQTVVIRNFNLLEKSFLVYTEMAVMPLDANLDSIRLNLGKNCKLPGESGGNVTFPVCVNEVETTFRRADAYEGMAAACREKSMAELTRVRAERLAKHDGELIIAIPPEIIPLIRRQICVKLSLEVYVRNPVDGVQFNVHMGADNHLERGAHAFTYRSSLQSSTSEWLPCIDAPDQLSLWTIHFRCDPAHVVVMSGELMECEQAAGGGEKTYHYQQLVPTAPMNMGWAVGHFTPCVHKDMPEMTNFALPGLTSLVTHTTAILDRTFEYLEELLSCRYPFPSFKQCFVDNLPEDVVAYSSFSLVSVNVLYHKKIIDVVQRTRQLLTFSVASQFFSCFISASDFADLWVVRALARYLTSLYVEKVFGRNESLFHSKRMLADLCEFESDWGSVMLRPVNDNVYPMTHAPTGSALTCSPLYAEQLWQKGELVIRLLAKKLGHEPFFQVLHKILSVGEQMGPGRRDNPTCWTYLTLTTNAFFRTVHSVTGQEMPTFLEQWVYGGGHASFHINFIFNRKRNMVELDIRQEDTGKPGVMMYTGPLTIVVQELDGCFEHHVQIDSELSRHELQCHSKGRKQKRKKVPLSTGEEVEVDLSNMDPDSPVLWVRVDPNMLLLREMHVRQPSYQWEYLLKYERDVLAQMTALDKIQEFPSDISRNILIDTINFEPFYYRVRCRAAFALSTVHNKMVEVAGGKPPLITLFSQKFGCRSAPHIQRSNNFVLTSTNMQTYFLMQTLPQSIGRMRNKYNSALAEAHSFILDLLYYNDNTTNRYADDHYRASLLIALSSTIVVGETLGGDVNNPASMSTDASLTLRELTHALNMDTLRPSYSRVVSVAALFGIYQMQKTGIIPVDSTLFWKFAHPQVFVALRRAALWILVDRLAHRGSAATSHEDLLKLIRMSIEDTSPEIRRYVAELLARRPPFESPQSCEIGPGLNAVNTARVAEQLWAFITAPRTESRVRSLLCDVWFSMYGWGRPPALGGTMDGVALPERRAAPIGRRIEGRTPEPLCGWHSSDVVLEKRDSGSAAPLEDRNDDEILQ
ncbi:taf-2, partial [Pristionchus pacificus]